MSKSEDAIEWGSDLDRRWDPLGVPDPEAPLPPECARPTNIIDGLRGMAWQGVRDGDESGPAWLAGEFLDLLYGRDLLKALEFWVDDRVDSAFDEDGEPLDDYDLVDDGCDITEVMAGVELVKDEFEEPEGWSVIVPNDPIDDPPPKDLLGSDTFAYALRRLVTVFVMEKKDLHARVAAVMARALVRAGDNDQEATLALVGSV